MRLNDTTRLYWRTAFEVPYSSHVRGVRIRIISLVLIGLLVGCATPSKTRTTAYSRTSSGCTWIEPHQRQDGSEVTGYYRCSGSQYTTLPASGQCIWVDSYYRKDGTYVSGHHRCASQVSATPTRSIRGRNCHTVRGHYRKDGTYVRGHTRCR